MAEFSERLGRLMDTVHPAGRGPYTLSEITVGLAECGVRVSRSYLSHLRRGSRTNPKPEIVSALAQFFAVSPAYFYDDNYARKLDQDLDLIVQLRDSQVRKIAERSYALSEHSRQVIADMVDHLGRVEGIPVAGDTPT